MAKTDRAFVIPFTGLKIGMHTYEFDIVDAFFEQVEYSLIEKGNVRVTLNLEKKETMMIGDFHIEGEVKASCDLCNDPVNVEVDGDYQLIFKFDDKPSDDETLIIVYPEEFELDLQENILELITVSLPSRTIHPEGECDSEMLEILNEYRINSDDEDFDEDFDDEDTEAYNEDPMTNESEDEDDEYIDPRWAALKGLGKKKEDE
ncbi:MAG: DUF177 domain-containing protein [Crocinitomicaceae bacterium]